MAPEVEHRDMDNGGQGHDAVVLDGARTGNGRIPEDSPALALVSQIESLLFVADEPVTVADLARALNADRHSVVTAIDRLADACAGRGVRVQRTNGRVQMVSAPESAEAIQRFLGLETSARLSRAALEVLAMVAYRQPVTRPEVESLRGVNSEASLRTLLSRGLVEAVSRRPTVGHPIEYGTTFLFLEYFGLTSLDDLPPVEAVQAARADAEHLACAPAAATPGATPGATRAATPAATPAGGDTEPEAEDA